MATIRQLAAALLAVITAACVTHGAAIALRARRRTQLAQTIQQQADPVKESTRDERKRIFERLNRQIREAEIANTC